MHRGAKRQLTEREAEEQRREAQNYLKCEAALLAARAGGVLGKEALKLSLAVLLQNPFHNTAWNLRRDVLEGSDSIGDFLAELKLTGKAIGMSAKVYSVWEHRKYVLRRMLSLCNVSGDSESPVSPGDNSLPSSAPSWSDVLHDEKEFLRGVFSTDAKNFHAWNYRRFLADLFRERGMLPRDCPAHCFPEDKEFTEELISQAYDNHSAWHQRQLFFENASEEERATELDYVAGLLMVDPGCESLVDYFLSMAGETGLPVLQSVVNSVVAEATEDPGVEGEHSRVVLPENTWKLLAVLLLLTRRHDPEEFQAERERVLSYYEDPDIVAKLAAVFPV